MPRCVAPKGNVYVNIWRCGIQFFVSYLANHDARVLNWVCSLCVISSHASLPIWECAKALLNGRRRHILFLIDGWDLSPVSWQRVPVLLSLAKGFMAEKKTLTRVLITANAKLASNHHPAKLSCLDFWYKFAWFANMGTTRNVFKLALSLYKCPSLPIKITVSHRCTMLTYRYPLAVNHDSFISTTIWAYGGYNEHL